MARQVLGRGLSALLREEVVKTSGEELIDLDLDFIYYWGTLQRNHKIISAALSHPQQEPTTY